MVLLAMRMIAGVTETRNIIPSLEFKTCMTIKSGYFFKKQQDKIHGTGNLSTEQRDALINLSKDSSIIVNKPDKGNGVVIMDRTDYESKMKFILDNQSK